MAIDSSWSDIKERTETQVLFFRNVEILPMQGPLGRKKKHIYIQRIFSNSLIQKLLSANYYYYNLPKGSPSIVTKNVTVCILDIRSSDFFSEIFPFYMPIPNFILIKL